ncbi:hypothetical protein [Gluconobacter morbifer]|uniref:DUF4412 domain-containing protein n=1 Tax=Gluconobacter morbifer G707 TaxID=1088869 RepID=G6XFT7_9PROT|nr:hypothetical protein [Gluconobacter morbifer]EHH69045.1 hypothetical protein GMO_03520 [Gluconobacter morbifer G707]
MMKPVLFAVLAVLGAAASGSAHADAPASMAGQAPLVTPLHDTDIDYAMTDPNGQQMHQRMRWSSALWRQRIDPQGSATFMLTDYRNHKLMVLDSTAHTATVMSAPGASFAAPGTPALGSWKKLGGSTVAGLPCTVWESADTEKQPTDFCYTDDGLMLRASHGGRLIVQALSVSHAQQPAALFDPPPGYRRNDAAH